MSHRQSEKDTRVEPIERSPLMQPKNSNEFIVAVATIVAEKVADEKIQAAIEEAMKYAADYAATAAIRAVEKERKRLQQEQYDWKYHNTKLLIRNYRVFRDYLDHAVFKLSEAEKADDSFEDILRIMQNRSTSEEMFVESIKRNFVQTKIIMTHVDKMLEVYEYVMCVRSQRQDDARRWRVLYNLYLSDKPLTPEQIAQTEHIDKRTVYKDVDTCITDLTALMFGISGIKQSSQI